MRRTCKVCSHKKSAQIDIKIRNGSSLSSIGKQYGLSRTTIRNHRDECMVKILVEDEAMKDAIVGDVLIKQVNAQIELVHKLIKACDEWLTDPEDPDKYYLGPRGTEIDITYQEVDKDTGRILPIQRKATLQEIMQAIESEGYIVKGVKFNHADPRELLLKSIGKLEGTVKMINESSQRLIEWEYQKKALAKLDEAGVGSITFEEQISNITQRVIIARKPNDTEDLMTIAAMPKIKK